MPEEKIVCLPPVSSLSLWDTKIRYQKTCKKKKKSHCLKLQITASDKPQLTQKYTRIY